MRNILRFLHLTFVFTICHISNFAFAQDWPGINDSLYSNSLKENRQFQVILPKNYDSGTKDSSYEVLYVLDGQYYIKDVPFIYNWTVQSGYMPEMILVIVPNVFIEGVNQRRRDFTPTIPSGEEKGNAVAGGADNFLLFLHNELVPKRSRISAGCHSRDPLHSFSGVAERWATPVSDLWRSITSGRTIGSASASRQFGRFPAFRLELRVSCEEKHHRFSAATSLSTSVMYLSISNFR